METREEQAIPQEHGLVLIEEGTVLAVADGPDDPVLAALARTEDRYRAARARWERDAAEARRAREEAADALAAQGQLLHDLEHARGQLDRERQRTARQRERAQRLAAALKDVHRALFGGNVFDLILKACLSITGATRGLYVTAWGTDRLRVRSAVDFDGYPSKPPSAFVRAVCEKALRGGETYVCNDAAELAALPPADADEAVRNCLAAPAILLKEFSGVVVLADKPGGFDKDDVELVLGVGDQAGVALENRQLQDDLFQAYFSVVGVLADAMEAKDPYTQGHCELVARYARRTAARLGADDVVRSVCCYGGLLHDIGKIGVSDGVLNKPGQLLPEEWELMRSHVRIGRDLLRSVPALDGVTDVVLHHHERYDGQGYPDGLSAEQISLAARIVCVADAYCAMISKRSYKESSTPEEARQELVRCKGKHFDPQVVDAFLLVLDEADPGDDCPDGCGLLPTFHGADDFKHVLRAMRTADDTSPRR